MPVRIWLFINLIPAAILIWTLFLGGDQRTVDSPLVQRVMGFRDPPELETVRFFAWLGVVFVIAMTALGAVYPEVRDFFVEYWKR